MGAIPRTPSTPRPASEPDPAPATGGGIVNDFSLAVATANGTGSQTANLTLLRSFFRMGIPVHGKNIFPSNIQGLPTWYHIRVSRRGFVARREPELLVAYNPATVREDVAALPPGGVVVLDAGLPYRLERDDLTAYEVPVKDLTADAPVTGKLKSYIANMTYVGVLAHLLDVPVDVVREALSYHFGGRAKLIEPNLGVVEGARAWAEGALTKRDPYRVAPMDATDDLILMTGNEAGALGAIFGGASVAAWYPITPSTSFIDALREHLPGLRTGPDGTPDYAVVQAEDELAAIGMVLGAGWAGARALTATSGPGISLMAEFAGLGHFAEIPAVVWDVQRVGPSTGLPTRTSQGDLAFVYGLGHGDGKQVVLLPSSIEECFELGWRAHDLADELQTPVFVLSDLDLGMNNWMGRPFEHPGPELRRGKVLSAEEVEARGFRRYHDADGDGIGWRTLPGNESPGSAWFARGTGHDADAVYSERAGDWVENTARLARKLDTARTRVPAPVATGAPPGEADLGVIAFGTTRWAIEEALADLAGEDGRPDARIASLRLRALPLHADVRAFVERVERVAVLEMNRDAQLCAILRDELPDLADRFVPVAFLDGMPWTASFVRERLEPLLPPRKEATP